MIAYADKDFATFLYSFLNSLSNKRFFLFQSLGVKALENQ